MNETAIERYLKAAIDHGRATMSGDPDACNVAHDRIMGALAVLRKLPDRGEAPLVKLASHTDESVRTWAATHLLPLNEPLACNVLEDVATGASIVAFGARVVLREWRSGHLRDL